MANVQTFAWLPDEHEEFVGYLATIPDIWARTGGGDGDAPVIRPAAVAEYFARRREAVAHAPARGIYLGSRAEILHPPMLEGERIDGGAHVPFIQDGHAVPGVSTNVGGTPAKSSTVDIMAAELLDYAPGDLHGSGELTQSNLYFYSGFYRGAQYVTKSDAFIAWAKRVFVWVRRRTTAKTPVAGLTSEMKCTPRVAAGYAAGTLTVKY